MKKLSLFVFVWCISYNLFAQQNLVPNPSFEEYDSCPDNGNQVYKATGWSSYRESPDYFNSCATTIYDGVPKNGFGYQYAATGDAYIGLFTYGGVSNYREYIGTQLSSPLVVGNKYFISIKVSLADDANCATNNIGVIFSNVQYNYSNPAPISNNSIVYSQSIISDTANWTIVSGSFVADSAFQYLIIGNFYTDSLTDSIVYSVFSGCNAYYYVDDVCVSPDSLACDLITTQNVFQRNIPAVAIFPNPAKDFLNLCLAVEFSEVSIYDFLGRKVYQTFEAKKQVSINTSEFLSGVYFLLLKTESNISTTKFLIQK